MIRDCTTTAVLWWSASDHIAVQRAQTPWLCVDCVIHPACCAQKNITRKGAIVNDFEPSRTVSM